MLAASKLGSNVPPYHLQTPPVMVLTGITADEFKKNTAAAVLKTYPAQFTQQHTARQQPGWHPFIVVAEDRKFSARIDSNCLACVETLREASQFKPSDSDPDKTACGPQHDVDSENQYEG